MMQINEYANQETIDTWTKLDWEVWLAENRRALLKLGLYQLAYDLIY